MAPTRFDVRVRVWDSVGGSTSRIVPGIKVQYRAAGWDSSATLTLSRHLAPQLPNVFEFALEVWNGTAWSEPRNCRFITNRGNDDYSDPAKFRTLRGILLWRWLATKATLADSTEVSVTNAASTEEFSLSGLSRTGTYTYIKTGGHGLAVGDQVKVVERGKNRTLKTGSKYYVRKTSTTEKFTLSSSRSGSEIKHGNLSSGLKVKKLADRIIAIGHGFQNGYKVRVSDKGTSKLKENKTYYVVRRAANSFSLAEQAGGRAIEIGQSTGIDIHRSIDGVRGSDGMTPGKLVRRAFTEAQARGWATWLGVNFTDTHQSTGGAAWPQTADWPVDPGATTDAQIQLVIDTGMAYPFVQGRTLGLNATEPSTDRTTGNDPVRLPSAAEQPSNWSLDNLITHATVVGRGRVRATSAQATGGLGRLEAFEARDTTRDSYASTWADRLLATGSELEEELQTTYRTVVDGPRPLLDFSVGDWVLVAREDGHQRRQVKEIVIDKDANQTTATVISGSRIMSLTRLLARQNAKSLQLSNVSASGLKNLVPAQVPITVVQVVR